MRTVDSSAIRIYLSTEVTDHKLYTLMHDPQYRVEVARQQTTYNQPSYPSFYLGVGHRLVAGPAARPPGGSAVTPTHHDARRPPVTVWAPVFEARRRACRRRCCLCDRRVRAPCYGVTMLNDGSPLSSTPSSDGRTPGLRRCRCRDSRCRPRGDRAVRALVKSGSLGGVVGGPLDVDEHAVAEGEPVVRVEIGEGDVERTGRDPTPSGPLTEIARESNSCSGRQLGDDRGRGRHRRGAEVALAELGGAGEEEVAPGAVLGAVAELFERVGVQRAGRGRGRRRRRRRGRAAWRPTGSRRRRTPAWASSTTRSMPPMARRRSGSASSAGGCGHSRAGLPSNQPM